MIKQIKFEDLKQVEPKLKTEIVSAWIIGVQGSGVSIIKWSDENYDGMYEIYSSEKLFTDVERYKSMHEVIERLNVLNEMNSGMVFNALNEKHDCNEVTNTIDVVNFEATCMRCGKVSKVENEAE